MEDRTRHWLLTGRQCVPKRFCLAFLSSIEPKDLFVATTMKKPTPLLPQGSDLPPCRRFITTHGADGKSVHLPLTQQAYRAYPGTGYLARSYALSETPAKLESDADVVAYQSDRGPASFRHPSIVIAPTGVNLTVLELEPGAVTGMHQTDSVDFSICVLGTIDHELDSGEVQRLYPGVITHALLLDQVQAADKLRIILFNGQPCTGGSTPPIHSLQDSLLRSSPVN